MVFKNKLKWNYKWKFKQYAKICLCFCYISRFIGEEFQYSPLDPYMNYRAMETNQIVNMVGWWVATVIMVIYELGLQITVYILYYVGIASLYYKKTLI